MINGTTLQSLVTDPSHARLICEVLADTASVGRYPLRKAYQVLRALPATELWDLYEIAMNRGNPAFREAFGPVYHRLIGDGNGPLFAGYDDELFVDIEESI